MHLEVLVPSRVEVDEDVERISAEATYGWFTLLPRHADIVAQLVPGILSWMAGGEERWVAVDGGTLVKCGGDVRVSTPGAFRGELGELQRVVDERFHQLSEQDRRARSALEKLQADFVRRFLEWERRV